MMSTGRRNSGIPAFTVMLIMVALSFVGMVIIPTLEISYTPETSERNLSVSFSWPGVSERIVEYEATSKIEGALSGIRNCTKIASTSSVGGGRVDLTFRKDTDMQPVRFEVASRIRNIYSYLPDGVSYPSISLDIRGAASRTDLVYTFISPLPSYEIEKYVSNHVIGRLAEIDGVEDVGLNGVTSYEIEILFDPIKAEACGISAGDISNAFSSFYAEQVLGLAETSDGVMTLKLSGSPYDSESSIESLNDIPVKNADGRIVHLSDIASFRYKEAVPRSYFRVNGLNTITMDISASPQANLLTVASNVKKGMTELQESFPEEISVMISYDSSEYMTGELKKIVVRTLLCILILLLFVLVVYRSFKYLAIIFTTLLVNIFTAIVIYKIAGLGIHIYTLAGITVSLGIIIDSTIVMCDHYSYYHDRKVFPALFGATATTIAALCVIYLLPEADRKNLDDFSKVIIINLSVALVTAYAFVPSLLDRFPIRRSQTVAKVRRSRRIIRFNKAYSNYIGFGQRHKWLPVTIFIIGFGIPLCLLPDQIGKDIPEEQRTSFQNFYNKVMSWKPYSENKTKIDNAVGTSFALFNKALGRGNFYRTPERKKLYVEAGMPEGCTIEQLNDVVRSMENYLSQFDEIETFMTSIYSSERARIEIAFKPEYERTLFPSQLKSLVTESAINFGGANWRVYGVDENYFSNDVVTDYRSNRFILKGYNYDELYEYAQALIRDISKNKRVSKPEMMAGYYSLAGNEMNLDFDFSALAARGINPYRYFNSLETRLYDEAIGALMYNGSYTPVELRSADLADFDLWHLNNVGLDVDSVSVKLSEFGQIQKKRTGLDIQRENQSYSITVGYDFIGAYQLSKAFEDETINRWNSEVLPVGYKVSSFSYDYRFPDKKIYSLLILLVIAIIYVICSMIFESLRMPFAVILMIPISFIGVFLTFGLTDFTFDQGGFAALVMLSGIVVNAGIYLVNEYIGRRKFRMAHGRALDGTKMHDYVKSFNHKIHPIMLTIISTVLGLIPFLFDGPSEVFWFPFAVGTISGLLFSLIALLFYMPLFCFKEKA
jgi:multidrug efflux pump subunit AcrB